MFSDPRTPSSMYLTLIQGLGSRILGSPPRTRVVSEDTTLFEEYVRKFFDSTTPFQTAPFFNESS